MKCLVESEGWRVVGDGRREMWWETGDGRRETWRETGDGRRNPAGLAGERAERTASVAASGVAAPAAVATGAASSTASELRSSPELCAAGWITLTWTGPPLSNCAGNRGDVMGGDGRCEMVGDERTEEKGVRGGGLVDPEREAQRTTGVAASRTAPPPCAAKGAPSGAASGAAASAGASKRDSRLPDARSPT